MKKFLLLTLITATLFIAGCKKNTIDAPVLAQKVSLISSDISYSNFLSNDTTLYKYDNQNRLIEVYHNIISDTTTSNNDYKFTYDSSNRVIQLDIYKDRSLYQRSFYTYHNSVFTNNNSASITESDSYYTNGFLTDGPYSSTLSMNDNQFVTKIDFGGNYYDAINYDNNGNISSNSFYAPTNLTTPQESLYYSYDNKKSRFSNIKGNFYLFNYQNDLKNNMVSLNYSSIGHSTIYLFYSYLFNADGYPTKQTQTNSVNSYTEIHNYTYIIQ